MIIDLNNLPSNTAVLHQIITDLVNELHRLRDQLSILKAKRFGKSSEKIDKQIGELEFRIEEHELLSTIIANSLAEEESKQRESAKRKKLPEDLPRIDVVLPHESKCHSCGSEEFRKLSDDISETLEYIPSSFKVKRYIRPRAVCINCESIVQACPASKTIDKGKAEPGLLAHILIQKYCNHLPLYRQSQIYEREGIELARSTMSSWAQECSKLLEPLVDEIRKSVFSSSQIHGDDTPVRVLAPGLGRTKTGRLWTYVRDGRPYGDKTPPAVCYFYSPDRKGERPAEHLKDFVGVLHADAYAGYNGLYTSEETPQATITEAACWAHTRRKFHEITVANDNANIAIAALERIAEIYKIEAEIKGLDPGERLKRRLKESKVLVEKLFTSFKKFYKELPKKSITAKAIAYALNNQAALMRFLEDGRIEIDNNAAERAMRAVAVGRKNWLFAGSDNGGHTAAAFYSIIETAKLNGINPWKYLQQVLATIQDYNSSKISDLLPWNITIQE